MGPFSSHARSLVAGLDLAVVSVVGRSEVDRLLLLDTIKEMVGGLPIGQPESLRQLGQRVRMQLVRVVDDCDSEKLRQEVLLVSDAFEDVVIHLHGS